MTDDTRAELTPVAWCDDSATSGGAGNCASDYAKRYWANGHWVERESAARLRHPLYSADQLAAAITAERTRCAAIARKHGAEDAAREMEVAE